MLERASDGEAGVDCEDPLVMTACLLDSEDCPAACREAGDEDPEDIVVKSGDLAVSATAANNRKVIIGGVSDLDTINFKASEDITLNKVTLERYGYSSNEGVTVWLEDELGNKVTNEKTSTKDDIVLTLKKDYKELSKDSSLVIVASVASGTAAGTIGFKVKDIDCSAENVNLKDYEANTYDMIVYNGTQVALEVRGASKTYHYAEGEMYEVARIQVKAGSAAVSVNGFSFENAGDLDLSDFADEVVVTADGKEVKSVQYTAKKKDFKVSFDDVNIDSKKNVTFVVSVSLSNLDEFGRNIQLKLDNPEDINAVESKTQTRVTIKEVPSEWNSYLFNGGKITLSNTKLASTIDAAQGSQDVVVAEGSVTLGGEAVELNDFVITANGGGIDTLTMVVNGDEFDSTREIVAASATDIETAKADLEEAKSANPVDDDAVAEAEAVLLAAQKAASYTFTFKDVVLEKSGKVQFVADMEDEDMYQGNSITINNVFAKALLNPTKAAAGETGYKIGEYADSGETAIASDFVGSISISNIKVQAAQGSLVNSSTKPVEVVRGSSVEKTLFDGTYTAKKGDVYLNKVIIAENSDTPIESNEDLTFDVYVNNKIVATLSANGTGGSEYFTDDVLVEKGEKVSVKVIAHVYAEESASSASFKYELTLAGVDANGIDAGEKAALMAQMNFVSQGSVTVTDNQAARKQIELVGSDIELGRFYIKPSKGSTDIDLDSIELSLTTGDFMEGVESELTVDDVKNYLVVSIDGNDYDVDSTVSSLTSIMITDIAEKLPEDGAEVIVRYSNELSPAKYTLNVSGVNNKPQGTSFNKAITPVLVTFTQTNTDDETTFVANIETYDDSYTVKNISIAPTTADAISFGTENTTYADGTELKETVANGNTIDYITGINYTVVATNGGGAVSIEKTIYKEFFNYAGSALKIAKAKDN